MYMDAILRITAIVLADADAILTTDRRGLVDDLSVEFPRISRETLRELVDVSITTVSLAV